MIIFKSNSNKLFKIITIIMKKEKKLKKNNKIITHTLSHKPRVILNKKCNKFFQNTIAAIKHLKPRLPISIIHNFIFFV